MRLDKSTLLTSLLLVSLAVTAESPNLPSYQSTQSNALKLLQFKPNFNQKEMLMAPRGSGRQCPSGPGKGCSVKRFLA